MASRTGIKKRRSLRLGCVILAGGVFLLLHQVFTLGGAPSGYYTGAVLFLLVLVLALFNQRKKIPQLGLIRASTWTQWHIYLGIFASFLFFLHAGIPFDGGLLDKLLAACFLLVCLSGFLGLWLTRSLPPRMTLHGENLTFERCGGYRRQIQESTEEFILKAEEDLQSSSLSDFYLREIRPYLARKAPLLYPFYNRAKMRGIHSRLKNMDRFLSSEERIAATRLASWIETKENLDFQESSQRLLRGWLFFHIPGTLILLLLVAVHIWSALQYGTY